jgi:phage terminase small subunit
MANLHSLREAAKTTSPRLFPELWLTNPMEWNRQAFIDEIADLVGTHPTLATTSKITMLACQIESFVKCQIHIKQHGLTLSQNNGATVGQNPHVKIADNALHRSMQILKDLGLGVNQQPRPSDPQLAELFNDA